ncbi:MAG: type II secretion system GspH family protein [Candidatus Uhrbacteria bacterium]|nr:type II secretion system GspH family protein [Candidatus Uhrbacteria bacterium]
MKRARGFTLIELLVVIAIIGLLATFAVVQLGASREKARDTKRKQDLVQMQKAIELYYNENGSYPNTGGAWRGGGSGCTYGPYSTTGTTGYIPGLAPQYIGVLPLDPRPGTRAWPCTTIGQSCYLYNSNGTDYKLIAHCGIEGAFPKPDEPFYDPYRPTWGIMVCNQGSTACAGW